MKLKQPVTVTITESESLAFLWHIFNHSGLIAKGAYNLNGISKKDLIELGNQAHINNNFSLDAKEQKYYGNKHEIMAFANMIIEELRYTHLSVEL